MIKKKKKRKKNPHRELLQIEIKPKYYLNDRVPSQKEIGGANFDEVTTYNLYYNQIKVASLVVVPEENTYYGSYNNIVEVIVYKKYRRKGFGKYLLNYVTNLYWKKNLYPIMLRAEPFDDEKLTLEQLIKFYQSCGFRLINNGTWMMYEK